MAKGTKDWRAECMVWMDYVSGVVSMAESDMVNMILLSGNLLLAGALFLCLYRKRRGGMGETGTASFMVESVSKLLEFTVYGSGMIRVADLVLQGIAVPGEECAALFAVRILLAESMLFLFPLWKLMHRWKREEDRDVWRRYTEGEISEARETAYGGRGEYILGMVILLGLTLYGWREQDLYRAFGRQIWILLLFFAYGHLKARRQRPGKVGGPLGKGETQNGCDGYGRPGIKTFPESGRTAGALQAQGFARNTEQARAAEYLRNLEQQYQRTRELWHDLKNHIHVLEILAEEGRFGEFTDYLDSFRQDVERRMIPARTGCAAVDALLGDKLYGAKSQGTEMALSLCGLSDMGIEAVDLCVILGNLLDNALEACSVLRGRRYIRLQIRREEDFYYISVTNPAKEPVREGEGYATGKLGRDNGVGHGLGLRSAERIAHRYGGLLVTDYIDGEFKAVVRMQAAHDPFRSGRKVEK